MIGKFLRLTGWPLHAKFCHWFGIILEVVHNPVPFILRVYREHHRLRLKNRTEVDGVPIVRKKLTTDCSVQELTSKVRTADRRDGTGDGMKAGGRKEPLAIAHNDWYSKSGTLKVGARAQCA
jgi:hypothetical protein